MAFNNINRTSVGADYEDLQNVPDSGKSSEGRSIDDGRVDALEHSDPGIHMGRSTVMLSLVLSAANGAAKHLAAQRDRLFAEFTLSATNGLRVTG
jgi:hypothetical protein